MNFFENWHMDRIFLFLTLRKKSSNFIDILIQYTSKTKIANSSKKLCTDFLVALSVETPWMFNLFPPKQRKFTS